MLAPTACGGGAGTTEEPPGDGALVEDTGEGTDTGADTSADDTGAVDTGLVDTGKEAYVPPDGACTGPVDVPGCGLDTDCDGITDTIEGRYDPAGARDTDKDGTPDYKDEDSDGDGVPDRIEWRAGGCATEPLDEGNDVDGDGLPNFQDLDSDGNGLDDADEICPPAAVLTKLGMAGCDPKTPYDFDGDGTPDFLDLDNDHDSSKTDKTIGLGDKIELANGSGAFVGLSLDTDGDGIPDVYDVDSDGDFILDLDDGTTDDDGDGKQAFRDTDTDGDGVPDWCEARAKPTPTSGDMLLALLDSDGDGIADYRDLDSDGDLLADGKEDKDGDCKLDATETNRLKKDTDGDGHDDMVETALTPTGSASWALDVAKTPHNQGKFYFIEPWSADGSAAPSPTSTPLALSTSLNQGDVAFMIDTTYSMGDIEAELASSIATIIPKLAAKIPDLQLGVVAYDDVLAKPFGDTVNATTLQRDSFIWFPNGGDPTKGSFLTASTTDAIDAAKGLNKVTPGGTFPEGSVPALWWAITGDAMSFTSTTTTPATVKTFPAASGVPADRFGGLRFRKNALPIVIQASDANMHNGLTTNCLDGSGVLASPCGPIQYPDAAAWASSIGRAPKIADLAAKLVSVGARYIGISVHGTGGTGTGRSSMVNRTTDGSYYQASKDMLYLAEQTKAMVAPSVLGGTTTDCKTSNPTATLKNAAVSGLCPLVFDLSYDGAGLSDAVVNGVVALVNAIKFDVHVKATPVMSGTVDPVNAFLSNVLPMPAGGTDPVSGGLCVTFPATQTADRFSGPKALTGADGSKETILDLSPGPLYCFAVTPKPNTTVKPTTVPQTFTATLQSHAQKPDGTSSPLGVPRQVLFIVPPTLN
ncbi:MAG: hypothetical protein HYV09_05610 [Deltaproteobacteria bacterium]|nr:hypothetical protein [Deltaproteobacteria bacterium]